MIGCWYECPDACTYRLGQTFVHDAPYPIVREYFDYLSEPDAPVIAQTILSRASWAVSQFASEGRITGAMSRLRSLGAADKVSLNAIELDGGGCMLGSFRATKEPMKEDEQFELARAAGHLVAAHRLRRRFGTQPHAESSDAILEPGGRLVHATPASGAKERRDHLERAVRARDRARERKGRSDAPCAAEGWAPFVDLRWTLVDCFESDGRRFVLAIDNRTQRSTMDLLSDRERDVVGLALRGLANKAIAYELGLAQSTVRVLMARAQTKVGVGSRRDLVEKLSSTAEGQAGAAEE